MTAAAATMNLRATRPSLVIGLIIIGLLCLYIPMFIDFGVKFWWNEEDSHSGILLIGIIWAYWSDRAKVVASANVAEWIIGVALVAIGVAIYVAGRISLFFQLQGISLPIIAFGLTLGLAGREQAQRWMLINILLVFTMPLLGAAGDALLVPLRLYLTEVAAHFVSLFGYMVATSGVIVTVGFVDLNIAGACVGLRSMISIFAIGILFLHFFPLRGVWTNILFVAMLPVIGLLANFLRICTLIIVTGQFGLMAEAQIHDFAAYAEVGVAIGMFLLLAEQLQRVAGSR